MPTSNDLFLVSLAVERGSITPAQLDAAVRAQAQDSAAPPLDVLLVEQGALTPAQLEQLHRAGRAAFTQLSHRTEARAWTWRFAARALARGFASPEQVNRALREQALRAGKSGRWTPLGELLVEQGALSADQAAEALRLQKGESSNSARAPEETPAAPPPAAPSLLPHLEVLDSARIAALEEELASLRARCAAETARADDAVEREEKLRDSEKQKLGAAASPQPVDPPIEAGATAARVAAAKRQERERGMELATLRESLAQAERELTEARAPRSTAAALPGATWVGAVVFLVFLLLGLTFWPAAEQSVPAATEAELTRAIEEQPQSAELRRRRGLVYYRQERWADAIADFTAAASLDPASRAAIQTEWQDACAKLESAKK